MPSRPMQSSLERKNGISAREQAEPRVAIPAADCEWPVAGAGGAGGPCPGGHRVGAKRTSRCTTASGGARGVGRGPRIRGKRFDLLDIKWETRFRRGLEWVRRMTGAPARIEYNYLGIWRKDWRIALVKKIS